MINRTPETASLLAARAEIESLKSSYDQLAADGIPGSEQEQGFGNYYRDDPPERRNIDYFVEQVHRVAPQIGRNVLVVGGDGLAAQFLAENGLNPIGVDISSEMVEASRKRFAREGLQGTFLEADVTDLNLSLFPDQFAGIAFPHIIPCIPVVGQRDVLLRKALTDLSSLAPDGPFYISTTYYDDPLYQRKLVIDGQEIGKPVTYYYRPAEQVAAIVEKKLKREVLHIEHCDSALDPTNMYNDYKNWYMKSGPVHR